MLDWEAVYDVDKSCTGPRANRLPMHDRGSGTEGNQKPDLRGFSLRGGMCLQKSANISKKGLQKNYPV